MEEKRTEIITFRVDMPCPECKTGEMISTGIRGEGRKTIVHRCMGCGHQQYLDRKYPFIETKDKIQTARKSKA